MLKQEDFAAALRREISAAGSQNALARKAGMKQSQISDYLRGRFQIKDIAIGTLARLFPELEIHLHKSVRSEGKVSENLEKMLLDLYRSLPEDQQVRCFAMIMAHFGQKSFPQN